ncbi:hypothetical protein ACVFI8_19970 [Agarivorans sp. MS3-6]|uniref:hypothetical protein n=1 Tax=Agarivorans sp. TSD2052 TaxID=2937286 RepID=UPI00200BBD05|nr:hypothetical protein [Agarivorans sp. TSD2052]UPW16887.1 hypothetical protein M0C34_11580 [Agarivorans sp. TSD2052]
MSMVIRWFSTIATALALAGCGSETSGGGTIVYTGTGQVGSLAALVEFQQNLHAVNADNDVSVLHSEEPLSTEFVNRYGWNVETLHVYQDSHILHGKPNGITIYRAAEVATDRPIWIADLNHIRAFDPVVAHDGLAYYSTRDGNKDELTIRDGVFVDSIADILAYVPPTQQEIDEGAEFERHTSLPLAEYRQLAEPIGLAYREGLLYVCDAVEGLVALQLEVNPDDAAEFSHLLVKQTLNDVFSCKDVLATEQGLMLVGESGVTQLLVSNEGVSIISQIPTL